MNKAGIDSIENGETDKTVSSETGSKSTEKLLKRLCLGAFVVGVAIVAFSNYLQYQTGMMRATPGVQMIRGSGLTIGLLGLVGFLAIGYAGRPPKKTRPTILFQSNTRPGFGWTNLLVGLCCVVFVTTIVSGVYQSRRWGPMQLVMQLPNLLLLAATATVLRKLSAIEQRLEEICQSNLFIQKRMEDYVKKNQIDS